MHVRAFKVAESDVSCVGRSSSMGSNVYRVITLQITHSPEANTQDLRPEVPFLRDITSCPSNRRLGGYFAGL